jgi:hypothetical protein
MFTRTLIDHALSRRDFLRAAAAMAAAVPAFAGLHACGIVDESESKILSLNDGELVTLFDCYAVATYFDGGIGPHTGTITVAMIDANQETTLEFWHGHGGKQHQFKITPDHFQSIRDLKKTWIETTTVDNHTHKLFIDPVDPQWRVPGAKPVQIRRKRG